MRLVLILLCILSLCGCARTSDGDSISSETDYSATEYSTADHDMEKSGIEDAFTGYHVEEGVLYYDDSPVDTGIETLNLEETELSDYAFLNQFVNLRELYLDRSTVSDISFVTAMPQLEDFSLLGCENTTDFSSLQSCTQLKRLVLSGCTLSSLSDLSALSNLEVLLLGHTENLTSLDGIEGLKELIALDLEFSETADISGVASLENLEYLNLWGCRNIEDFSAICQLKRIKSLDLSNTAFSDLSLLASMNQLEQLYLTASQVQDYTPLLDGDFPNLTDLQCEDSDETDALREKYGEALQLPEEAE